MWPFRKKNQEAKEKEFLEHIIQITTYGKGLKLEPPKPHETVLRLIDNVMKETKKTG